MTRLIGEHRSIFVIGDIHGCLDEFENLLDILPLEEDSAIALVGDYIDRGPNSADVIQRVIDLCQERPTYPLMGNHESSLLEFVESPESPNGARFLFNGGSATLQSYSSQPGSYNIPDEHIEFVRSLPVIYETNKHILVHAGLPDIEINEIDETTHRHELLWIRYQFLASKFNWGKLIVHGHTPCEKVIPNPRKINVDTGCVFENKLSAINLMDNTIYEVEKSAPTDHSFFKEADWSKRRAVRFRGQVVITLEKQNEEHTFRTINYNDFGLLAESSHPTNNLLYVQGDRVRGRIEIQPDGPLSFTGKVVRAQIVRNYPRYAIEFLSPPKEPKK